MSAESFLTYETFVAGAPLFGMRLRDAGCALEYLLARPDVDAVRGVIVVGRGGGALLALHLAALDERVSTVVTLEMIESYRSLVEHERYSLPVSWTVPGVVRGLDSPNGYDVDDLIQLIAPRPVHRDPATMPPLT
jgi:pimeloyl-ACP methyl ester carboxylesterase